VARWARQLGAVTDAEYAEVEDAVYAKWKQRRIRGSQEAAPADAKEQALARLACDAKELVLLRAQRGHEHCYQRVCRSLLKVRAALMAEGCRPGGT
jgi:hypothetical protein